MGWVWVITITTRLTRPNTPIYLNFKLYKFNIYLKLYYIINYYFYLIFFPLFSFSYIKPNYLANLNNHISLSATSHSHSLTPLLFIYNWIEILVHVYSVYQLNWIYFVYNWVGNTSSCIFFYQLRWQVRYIFLFNLIIVVIIKKIVQPMGSTQPNLIHVGWVRLDFF